MGEGSPERPATVEGLVEEARSGLERLSPAEARAAAEDGAVLIDIRSDSQRERDGCIPGARFVPRNVLEWRLDPACGHRDPELARRDLRLIVICDEGFQSSLAAATVSRFGLRATDVIGGFRAWRSAGLPVEPSSVKPPSVEPSSGAYRPGGPSDRGPSY